MPLHHLVHSYIGECLRTTGFDGSSLSQHISCSGLECYTQLDFVIAVMGSSIYANGNIESKASR